MSEHFVFIFAKTRNEARILRIEVELVKVCCESYGHLRINLLPKTAQLTDDGAEERWGNCVTNRLEAITHFAYVPLISAWEAL
jgi:hypothetical protein